MKILFRTTIKIKCKYMELLLSLACMNFIINICRILYGVVIGLKLFLVTINCYVKKSIRWFSSSCIGKETQIYIFFITRKSTLIRKQNCILKIIHPF